MEKAYLITENTDLTKLKDQKEEIDRFYFWDAYCEHNLFYFLDNPSFVEAIVSLWKPLTLTTPLISNKNIDRLMSFIKNWGELPGFEVVVNDYWVFHYMKRDIKNIPVIWGNFLSWQNKDPYLKVFKDRDLHKRLSIDNDFYNDFFVENNISLLEIYNVFQWFESKQDYGLTLYYPYVVYSENRYCTTKLIYDQKKYVTIVEECDGCRGKQLPNLHMDLKMKEDSSKNFFRGNKQFYENKELSIQDSRIRRTIYNYDLI